MANDTKLSCIFLEDNQSCNAGLFEGKPTPGDCLGCTSKVWCKVVNGQKQITADVDEVYQKKSLEIKSASLLSSVNKQESQQEGHSADVSKGLGDTIAKATKLVGIKPCGACKKRQALLNKMVPYKTKDKNAQDISPNPTDDS